MFSFNNFSSNLRRMLGINRGRYNVRCTYKVLNEDEIKNFVENTENFVLDVRDEDEFSNMHIKNAINIPANKIDSGIYNVIVNKNAPILVYCLAGDRTNYAIQRLTNLGYTNIFIWGSGGINTLTMNDIFE